MNINWTYDLHRDEVFSLKLWANLCPAALNMAAVKIICYIFLVVKLHKSLVTLGVLGKQKLLFLAGPVIKGLFVNLLHSLIEGDFTPKSVKCVANKQSKSKLFPKHPRSSKVYFNPQIFCLLQVSRVIRILHKYGCHCSLDFRQD